MRTYRNEFREEGDRPSLGRRSKSDAAQPGVQHKIEGAGASAQTSLRSGLAFNGYPLAQRSLIQMQHHFGNQCAQRAVNIARNHDAEMMQAKPPGPGDHVHRQSEEEGEEEPIQTKPATGEIQPQAEEEEEIKPM